MDGFGLEVYRLKVPGKDSDIVLGEYFGKYVGLFTIKSKLNRFGHGKSIHQKRDAISDVPSWTLARVQNYEAFLTVEGSRP